MKFFENFRKKQEEVEQLFADANTPELKYQKIIELGKKLLPYPESLKTQDRLVQGCQSTLYLAATFNKELISFQAHSDALISSGLAYILIYVYSDLPPKVILKIPPQFLDDIGIPDSLSLTRSNGLSGLFLQMQQEALKYLILSSN